MKILIQRLCTMPESRRGHHHLGRYEIAHDQEVFLYNTQEIRGRYSRRFSNRGSKEARRVVPQESQSGKVLMIYTNMMTSQRPWRRGKVPAKSP